MIDGFFFFQAEDGIRDLVRSRGLGDVYKRQVALHVLVLPQSSVAVQVRVTLYSCGHKPSIVISEKLISTTASHSSMAVAVPKEGIAPHSIGLTTIGQVMTGTVLSCTNMVAEQVDELPQSSVAIQVRVTL